MATEGVFRSRDKESSFDESGKTSIQDFKSRQPPDGSCNESDRVAHGLQFWITVGVTQVVGIVCVILVVYWCTLYRRISWENAEAQFLLHPILMLLGLIFFYGDAIIVYRVLHFLPKKVLKAIHGALHVSAIVLSSVGLAAVFENHRRTEKDDLYSLHSWMGITTSAFFCLQYIFGFVTFFYPGLPLRMRAKIMPFHTFFGVGIFIMAVAAALMGLTEYIGWSPKYSEKMYIGNALGLLLVVFAFLVVFLATHSKYKRRPLPTD